MTRETQLIEILPRGLIKAVRNELAKGEDLQVALKGAYQEALICTDRRVMIIKRGLLSGRLFGSDVFQTPYSNVASAEVSTSLLTGYLEISTGGMQNTRKSFWSGTQGTDPNKAPNCIGITRFQAKKFRDACAFILGVIAERRVAAAPAPVAAIARHHEPSLEIDRLLKLHEQGIITEEQYLKAKQRVIDGE